MKWRAKAFSKLSTAKWEQVTEATPYSNFCGLQIFVSRLIHKNINPQNHIIFPNHENLNPQNNQPYGIHQLHIPHTVANQWPTLPASLGE